MRSTLDFKEFNSTRNFDRFYKVWKYAKSVDLGWRLTKDALGNAYPTIPDCTTCVNGETFGFSDGDAIGKMEITWYIKFKTRLPEGE